MNRQPGFGPSFAEALQANMAIKTDNNNCSTPSLQHSNSKERLRAEEYEMNILRDGMDAMASDLLAARHEAMEALDAKAQLELRCTKLSQQVESLRTALHNERRRPAGSRPSQVMATGLEEQSQQEVWVNSETASQETQHDNVHNITAPQATDIGKLQELLRFYKGNSERLSAEVLMFKEKSKKHQNYEALPDW